MKSMMKKGLLGLTMLLAGGYANATTVTIDDYSFTSAVGLSSLSFSLASAGDLDATVTSTGTTLNLGLFSITFNGGAYSATLFNTTNAVSYVGNAVDAWLNNSASYTTKFSFSNLAAGSYSLLFKSTGNLNVNFDYTATAPVPEPETYALMGVGLLGLLAARRKKSQAVVAA